MDHTLIVSWEWVLHFPPYMTSSSPDSRTLVPATNARTTPGGVSLDLPAFLAERIAEYDPSLPDIRDIRKFARPLPRFRSLVWTGRGGKGEWHFLEKATTVNVESTHSAVISQTVWEQVPDFTTIGRT